MRCKACGNEAHSPAARVCNLCGQPLHGRLPLAGELIGGCYRILGPLKRGGMGAVYLAEDQRALGRRCVVKQLLPYAGPPGSREAQEAAARFEEEARTLTRLRHPNTPQIFAFLKEHDCLYIAMEYISGADLEQSLTHLADDGRMVPGMPQDLAQTLRDGVEICGILEYLARQSPPVVHHDIKPANLIRDSDSHELFLVDFGSVARPLIGRSQVTTVYGTPGYAAPESYRGQSDPKSDVYALAATLYHLLTDDDPRNHPSQFPQLQGLPAPVAAALEAGLQLELRDRCDAGSLRVALERCLQMLTAPEHLSAAQVPPASQPALLFPGGEQPSTMQELVRPCLKWWGFAARALEDGRLSAFVHSCGYTKLADWIKQSLRQGQPADVVLDRVLRSIEPRLPPPGIEPLVRQLSLGVVSQGDRPAIPLTLQGRSGLARVVAVSAVPWLQFYPSELLLRPGERESLQISVNPDYAPAGVLQGQLRLSVYDPASKIVSKHMVEISAEVRQGRRGGIGRLDLMWILMALSAGFVVLTLLMLLRPPHWAVLSLLWIGLITGGISGLALHSSRTFSDLLVNSLAGLLGALGAGLILPLFLLKRLPPAPSAGQLLGVIIGAMLAPLLLHLFFES